MCLTLIRNGYFNNDYSLGSQLQGRAAVVALNSDHREGNFCYGRLLLDGYGFTLSGMYYNGSTAGSITYNAVTNSGTHTGIWSYPTGSDIRIKNSINPINEQYNKFFDLIKPCSFKYNQTERERFHLGFIAQEICDQLDISGIDPWDFAGLDIQHDEEDNDIWYLRYDEFVALNTWQIQKAKARISELETRVSQLESLLQANLD